MQAENRFRLHLFFDYGKVRLRRKIQSIDFRKSHFEKSVLSVIHVLAGIFEFCVAARERHFFGVSLAGRIFVFQEERT